MLSLNQAFVISIITYVAPYAILWAAERRKIDTIIQKVFKEGLGLPTCTSASRLMALGVHNTIDELTEAHLSAQKERLSTTPTGRQVMMNLGYAPLMEVEAPEGIPLEIRSKLKIAPLPRNMSPQHHGGRRTAREQTLERQYRHSKTTVFTDAADYTRANTKTAVVATRTGLITSFALRQATILEARTSHSPDPSQDHYHRFASGVSKVLSRKNF